MPWSPHPIETTHVILPPELERLTEQLSRNAHEVWARQRLRDGWRWGPERRDDQKTHPSLVSYDDLSDAEREYDRQVAMETVRAIVAMGFRIEAP